jgi:vacuolar-type H+-ATPase subunit H
VLFSIRRTCILQNDKSGEKMTILNSIKAAEAKAENLRADANEKVRIMLAEYKNQTEKTLQKMQEDFKNQEAELTEKLNRDIESKKSEIITKTALESEQIVKHAKMRTQEAVDYLLEKVLKS